jgi:uncharacterized membrane protein
MPCPSISRDTRAFSISAFALLLSTTACSDPVTSVASPLAVRASVTASVTATAAPTVTAIGNIVGYGVNDAGTIVGPSTGNRSSAYLWAQPVGLELLGAGGLAWDISGDGSTVGGKNSAEKPVVWTSTSLAGPWTENVLGDASFGGAVRAIASDALGVPVRMTGNVWRSGATKTPARWSPCTVEPGCTNGWLLTTVTVTPPITEAWGQDINPSGMIVGMEGSGCCRAAFWDANDVQSVLPPVAAGAAAAAWGINDAGTVIVGQSNSIAVAWVRASTSFDFKTIMPIALEGSKTCKGGGTSIAYAVNPDFATAGTIVGQACGAPVAWKVNVATVPVSIVKVVLPSSGRSGSGAAHSINRSTSAAHRIAGQVNGAGAYWTNF